MISYFKHIIKSHLGFLIFALLFIPLIQFLLIDVFTGLETKPFIESMLNMMPAQFKMIIGEQFFSSLSLEGAAGFGLNHPVVLTIMIVLVTTITSKHIAGAIENGSMELLLALPLKRTTLIFRLWGTTTILLCVLVVFTLAGLFAGVAIFDSVTEAFIEKTLKIAVNLWFLIMTIMGFSLMISVFMKESGRAASMCSIVVLVLYFVDVLSGLWKPLEFFKPFNVFYYYQPQKLLTGQRSLDQNLPVLTALILIFLGISLWQFRKRDL